MPPRLNPCRSIGAAAVALAISACSQLADLGVRRAPVTIDQPISGATRGSLLRVTEDPVACRTWLLGAGVGYRPVQDRTEDDFCRVTGAVTLEDQLGGAKVRLSPRRPMMTCRLAAAVALWRRQSVEPAAQEMLGARVREIDHLGVYACRRIYNQPEGRPSAHARAEAIDVAGFGLSDGRRISVAKDWQKDTPEGRFLHRIRDDACRVFGTTLSPDYNAAHANHLHLEAGAGEACS